MILTGTSETTVEGRRVPSPSNVSAAQPGSKEFFGKGEQFFMNQNFALTLELFNGDTAFKPRTYEFRITPVFNINYVNTRELGLVNIDVRKGTNRLDGHVALQDLSFEVHLGDTTKLFPFLRGRGSQQGESPYYDFVSVRFGIQRFISDFRGFIFSDNEPGIRFFGNHASNRYAFNVAYFNMLEKDTNSGLNTIFESRKQHVGIANFFWQDFLTKGYTLQFSLHYNNDRPSFKFDTNNFLARPAPIGGFTPHRVKAYYLGVAGDGHIGRFNLTHVFYQALGDDSINPIANRSTDVSAQFAAVEASIDRDWMRFKGSFLWSSGDRHPTDGKARGFDTIFDAPNFAGGIFSLWNLQAIRLTGTGVNLVNRNSIIPNLRTSKEQGQANFVNPGLFLFNAGADLDLKPKLRTLINVNFLRFHHTEPLELLLFQSNIRHFIGTDYSLGLQYRPLLNENISIIAGAAALVPGNGFKDIYTNKTLFSTFVTTRFTF
jgi:hypothetical protein